MSDSDTKLEAISLLRFLPVGTADIGDEVTREDLRQAGVGKWSAPCGRVDDLSADELGPDDIAPLDEPGPMAMEEYDEVRPAEQGEKKPEGLVLELRFSRG